MPRLADSHVHLDDERFDSDREAVLQRARNADVALQVIPGTDAASWPRIHALCTPGSGLFPAYGCIPCSCIVTAPTTFPLLSHWLDTKRPVAVGEIGLDFYQEGHDAQGQREYFRATIAPGPRIRSTGDIARARGHG